jgi:predicted dehydrogenase
MKNLTEPFRRSVCGGKNVAEDVIKLALIGAGNRGRGIFGKTVLEIPHRARFTAVVEPDRKRRESFAEEHGIPESMRFETPDEFFAVADKVADAVVIATHESQRLNIVSAAIGKAYHILVEKPLGSSLREVAAICEAAKEFNGVFVVCHQMRHVSGYAVIKSLVDSGRFGKVVAIQHSENLSYDHMAHSFVRGFFNNDRMSPMILSKSCHDMDLLCYLTGKRPLRVSSFGSLSYFKAEHAPEGSPAFCLDGCPSYRTCPYHVEKIYLRDDTDPAYIRQMGVGFSRDEIFELLKTNRFGRCVFHCDNNVVDHQVVNVEFEEGVTASFQMAGHNYHERRITKISMTNGEIYFDVTEGVIKAASFSPLQEEIIRPAGMGGTHLGGDRAILDDFIDAVRTGDRNNLRTSVEMSLDSHLLAFAAERSRIEKTAISLASMQSE